jgi:hypothetical protein
VLTEPLKVHVVNVVGGGEQDSAAVEMKADAKAVCRNGEYAVSTARVFCVSFSAFSPPFFFSLLGVVPLVCVCVYCHGNGREQNANTNCLGFTAGLKYDMVYCWIIRFNKERKIDRVRAYLDTDLLTRAIWGEQIEGTS